MAFIIDNNLLNSYHNPRSDFPPPLTLTAPCGFPQRQPRKKRSSAKRPKISENTATTSHGTGRFCVSRPQPDPSVPKIMRPCSECGKKFWSWKALFGHMRCHPERNWRGMNPPPKFCRSQEDYFSAAEMLDEDYEIAACLLMLANGPLRAVGQGTDPLTAINQVPQHAADPARCSNVFECSSCKKVFGSHHALGGHRASHKNVKGCFAMNENAYENVVEKEEEAFYPVEEGHKCSICWRVFSSGQALGGHMRCHWEPLVTSTSSISPVWVSAGNTTAGFDLNIPLQQDDDG